MAQDALSQGQSLDTLKLNKEQTKRLLELTNASSLTAVTFDKLETAAKKTATALANLTTGMTLLVEMIRNGEANDWSIDSETGAVTAKKVYKSQAEFEESGDWAALTKLGLMGQYD
jgi:hypothetical protein